MCVCVCVCVCLCVAWICVCVCKDTVGGCLAGKNASLQCSRVGVTGMKLSKRLWESFIIHY